MMKIIFVIFICLLNYAVLYAGGIISTDEAYELLTKGENIKFVDARLQLKKTFTKGHIPGAVSLSQLNTTYKQYGTVMKMFSADDLARLFRKFGLDSDEKIIVYGNGKKNSSYSYSTYIIALLNYVGINDTYLLNGGYEKWQDEDRPVEQGYVMPLASQFELINIDESVYSDMQFIKDNLSAENLVFIDVRKISHFRGEDSDKRLVRHGRIPGARHIFLGDFVKNVNGYWLLLSKKELMDMPVVASISENEHVAAISYCNTGIFASAPWFVFKYILNMGNKVKIYDGSMVEYSRSELPIEQD